MYLCKKCGLLLGILILLAGLGFLLADLEAWSFWNLNWWTVAFLLTGLVCLCGRLCPACCEVNGTR